MTRRLSPFIAFHVLALASACRNAPRSTAADQPEPPRPSTRSSTEPAHREPARQRDAGRATTPSPPPESAERVVEPPFPPEDIPPPHARSAGSGDGHWSPLGEPKAGDRAAAPPRLIAKTTLHPHPASRFITVTIAVVHLERASIGFVPGSEDPVPRSADLAAGLVPEADAARTIAVFNGGFQPKHGWWGMRVGPHEIVRPRNDGCTVALYRDGRVRIAMWNDVAEDVDALAAFRQTPPCLVTDGKLSSRLLSGNDRVFGGKNADRKTRRRSGIGISKDGSLLFFAVGEEGDARHLAEGLRLAGAHAAAQLDINWNWTRFLLVGDTDDGPRITGTLLPDMNHGRREYVERPSKRDFFYVARKVASDVSGGRPADNPR